MEKEFNICSSENKYNPCPVCHATFGMGITEKYDDNSNTIVVILCSCGHHSLGVQRQGISDWGKKPYPSYHHIDRIAFDLWNIQRKL
ncbi:MAG: hypothetical protein QM504_08000 [Pseudomonadota bacterium]